MERITTIALVLVLFDGGMHIGWSRFRAAAVPIVTVGVVGTFLIAAGAAVVVHPTIRVSWYLALLVATAVAPTDPAVVFSVLGRREITGRSGTILEGESGANDPVGIALMSSLIAAGGLSATSSTTSEYSSCSKWPSAGWSVSSAAAPCWCSSAGYRCPAKASTPYAP